MTTEKQIEANRTNAKKSTGPVSKEGKKASSLNALKHGFCSELVLLPDESEEVFLKTVANIYQRIQPQDDFEIELFERVVAAIWRLKRLSFVETQLFEMYMGSGSHIGNSRYPYASAFLSMCRVDLPNKLTRYEHAIEASLYKSLKMLEELRAARLDQDPTST